MKICALFLLIFNLSLSANIYSQQKKVNLELKNATSKELFAEIQRQTGYCFIFNSQQGSQLGPITISARDETVQNVLDRILRDSGFGYEFQNDIIIITPQKKEENNKNTLKGIVLDENKSPLPGVTIPRERNKQRGHDNAKGEFVIKLQAKDTLIISFIGMENRHLTLHGATGNRHHVKTGRATTGRSRHHRVSSDRKTEINLRGL